MNKLKERKTYFSNLYKGHELEKYLGLQENFNEDGLLIKKMTIDMEGNTLVLEERSYIGELIKEIVVNHIEEGSKQKTSYQYYGELLVEEIEHFEDESIFKTITKYDEQKRVIEILKTDEELAFLGKVVYEYEDNVKLEKKYDDTNFLFEESKIKFDSEGQEVEIIQNEFFSDEYVEPDRETQTIIRRFYNGLNLIEEEVERFDRIIYHKKNEYNSVDNPISSTVENNDWDFDLKVDYDYNSLNQLTSEIQFHDGKEVYSESFKYDFNGNVEEVIQKEWRKDHIMSIRKDIKNFY